MNFGNTFENRMKIMKMKTNAKKLLQVKPNSVKLIRLMIPRLSNIVYYKAYVFQRNKISNP